MFKLYINSGKGYEYIKNYVDLRQLLSTLDNLIIHCRTGNQILVIEYIEEIDCDNPLLFYNGSESGIEEYEGFRESILSSLETNSIRKNLMR